MEHDRDGQYRCEVIRISRGDLTHSMGLPQNPPAESISQSSKTQGGDVFYTAKIKLDETDPKLHWGMTVEAIFVTE